MPAATEIYTLSLHDALPISTSAMAVRNVRMKRNGRSICDSLTRTGSSCRRWTDRKSTRLNSSHVAISYAVFCLKKKKKRELVKELNSLKTLTGLQIRMAVIH